MKKFLINVLFVVLVFGHLYSAEIPKPTYDNSVVFSFTHYFLGAEDSEINYIKSRFGNGIYAPLCFSGFFGVEMSWGVNPGSSWNNIQSFKNTMDNVIAFAKEHNVGVHLTLNYGMARQVTYYNDAKREDVRNAQWYNDNNMSSSSQSSGASVPYRDSMFHMDLNHVDGEIPSAAAPKADNSAVNGYVFTTFSRYARKLRAHLEGKVGAAMAYLEQLQDANPDVLIVISAPGEAELNYHRIIEVQHLQDSFCDYSPFAVLEFRDWVRHEGLYAAGQEYAGQGYSGGGSRYQGSGGLANFNADFGTSFSTWDLKYFHWDLSDAVDTNYTDYSNPDPNIIPVAQYTQNGMMPSSGGNYIAGGFDPPRTMVLTGTDAFYDLWHTFRETLVYHFVRDMAKIARSSGFDRDKYYTHQIPGDYLFGYQPGDAYLNPRYYSSAAPMWTADAFSDTGLGITLYDVHLSSGYYRTSEFGIGGANSMSDNWAALEYNPEVIPPGVSATLGSVSVLEAEMHKLYNGTPHVISFFKWGGDATEYRFEGTNRETAAKNFFDDIRDKARQPVGTVFTPKAVESLSGSYDSGAGTVNLSWSSLIWTDLDWNWSDWGDFKQFVIYRGYTSGFTADAGSELVRQTGTSYSDSGFQPGGYVYYKIAAVNRDGVVGPVQTVAVNVNGGVDTPVLGVSTGQLSFSYVIGESTPSGKSFTVSNTGTGVLNWTAAESASWLSCSPTSGTQGDTVTVSVNPAGLTAGSYNADITVSAAGAAGSPKTVSVSFTVSESSSPVLSVSKTQLSFNYTIGGAAPPGQSFLVSNSGTGNLSWTLTENTAWFSCTPASGAQGDDVTVSVNPSGLSAGSYSGDITVSADGADGSPKTVTVSLTVEGTGTPVLSVSREGLNFGYILGDAEPPVQGFRISNSGTGALNWSASKNSDWLSCDPSSGALGAVVNISIDPTGLAVGTYSSVVTVSAPGADDSPRTVDVTLVVKNGSQNELPFGDFATPVDNAEVSSSIPVTGWVLDDVGVTSLKIYRDPVTGEGTGLVYVGDALFVEGARSDIEVAYPAYPANYQAGWGYMLLTNFLPNGGNGTFRLHAVATDTSGAEVSLGTKTIVCDNANAEKPFGAIDTPTQGGMASGSAFRNHGWALTPMPNLISTDGSTIDVYIDGVNVGHPVYNIYRSDIAAFFPWYSNSTGAGGYFDIDTTQYAEGVHTIAWIATDFVGNSDGIGSRYFTISNVGSGRTARGVEKASSAVPINDTGSIGVVKGFGKDVKLQRVIPGENGAVVSIRELERVEVRLPGPVVRGGHLVVGGKLKPLPIGSTLDTKNGIFYWMPGPGFVGDYTFEFIGKGKRTRITIKIFPK